MMKPDEKKLFDALVQGSKGKHPVYVREVVTLLGINEKRATFICKKWEKKGWYEFGVHVLAGWLTKEGIADAGSGFSDKVKLWQE
jgi:hypothetical protein